MTIHLHACAILCVFAANNIVAPIPQSTGGEPAPPVTITADPLPLKQDEEGTLTVHLVAQADLESINISVTAARGVVLVKPVPPATLTNVKNGARHDFEVAVRLTGPDFGLISVAAAIKSPFGQLMRNQALLVGTMPAPPARVPVGADEDLANLTLVKLASNNAVVRFGNKTLMVVSVGDRLGKNKAEVIEIGGGRLVLDETFVGADGKPNRARVTLKEGEKGGTRVQERNDEEPPQASRTTVVDPKKKSGGV